VPQWLNNTHGLVHFQYMGGFTQWSSRPEFRPGRHESASPVRRALATGSWVLLAESNGIINYGSDPGAWWNTPANAFFGAPPHPDSPSPWPAGGNQAYVDGSVAWVPFAEWALIHSYDAHAYFMAQKDLNGWVAPEAAKGPAWMRSAR
jgi:hypothetical protein